MSQYSTQTHATPDAGQPIDQLLSFDGPPEQFLPRMLEAQCRAVDATGAALFRSSEPTADVIAVWPGVVGGKAPAWLLAARDLVTPGKLQRRASVHALRGEGELYGQAAREHVVVVPLWRENRLRGATAYHLATGDPQHIRRATDQLGWATTLLTLHELRLSLQQRDLVIGRLSDAQQITAAANEHGKFKAAAIALCNEIAARFNADRASLGFVHGRYVKLTAMSHTEKIVRKVQLVQDLERVMEEAIDQDVEIVHPAPADGQFVERATAEFAARHGAGAVISLPIRSAGEPVAVVTLERPAESPWQLNEIEVLRLSCELFGPRLVERQREDRWFGARAATATRHAAAGVIGPKHTWAKLTALGVLIVAVVLAFARGPHRVEAPFTIEATQHRVVVAPFAGYIDADAESAKPGDSVTVGDPLVKLNTDELEKEYISARQEQVRYEGEADIALREAKPADRQIALARAEQAKARADLLAYRISRSNIPAPITGHVLAGDHHKRPGAPVELGQVLYEIAPLKSLRAEVLVPESRIADLLATDDPLALTGKLAATASPGDYLPVRVEAIHPMAEVIEQQNVFRVRVVFDESITDEQLASLRPGMEGLARIEVGRARYAWMWTRSLVNWIRMRLWL